MGRGKCGAAAPKKVQEMLLPAPCAATWGCRGAGPQQELGAVFGYGEPR